MGQMDFIEMGARLGMFFVPFLFALCFHEYAHGVVAKLRGDNTAERLGRLSLNPMVHADPIGTWLLPILAVLSGKGFLFGWAKPVPVDSRNLKRPLQDMFWIALAGPLSNLLLAFLVSFPLAYLALQSSTRGAFFVLMSQFLQINVTLAVFNLIPIHPLDGGKVIAPFLPLRWNIWLEHHQTELSMFLLFLLFFGIGGLLSIPVTMIINGLFSMASLVVGRFA